MDSKEKVLTTTVKYFLIFHIGFITKILWFNYSKGIYKKIADLNCCNFYFN